MGTINLRLIIRFLYRAILILSIIFICDRGIGLFLKFFYFNQKSGVYYKTTYSIDSTHADLLIFGSSRAAHHYVPEILQKRLQMTCFNTGTDGTSILSNYALFKAITGRYSPRQVIVDIRPYELGCNRDDYDRLSILLPYYRKYPTIGNVVDLRGPFENIKGISAIYPFNSLIIQSVTGYLRNPDKGDQDKRGYIPIFDKMKIGKIDTLEINTSKKDNNKIQALENIILTCRQKSIDLIFVNSPIYYIIKDTFYTKTLHRVCSDNNIRFLDMSNQPDIIGDAAYFADKSHLNDDGARLFTNMLIEEIQKGN